MKRAFSYFLIFHKNLVVFEKFLVVVLLFSMIFLSFGQVVLRNVFNTGFLWIDEVLRVQVLWVTFVGAALAMEFRQHIRIDLLNILLQSRNARKVTEVIGLLFALTVGLLLCYAAVDYVLMEMRYNSSVMLRGFPDWVVRLVMPYFFIAMSTRCVVDIYRVLGDKEPPLLRQEDSSAEMARL